MSNFPRFHTFTKYGRKDGITQEPMENGPHWAMVVQKTNVQNLKTNAPNLKTNAPNLKMLSIKNKFKFLGSF